MYKCLCLTFLAFGALAPAWGRPIGKAPVNVLGDAPGGNTSGGEAREKFPRADGYFHIDTPRSIARLKAMHANNYNYLIWNSPSDWGDLRHEFLPAAQKAGINVWVYLVPPGETGRKASYPYKTDYLQWAAELAKLSLLYPALQAWVIDDFTWNTKYLTPEYVAKMHAATQAINPKLCFFPVLHFTALSQEFLEQYGPSIDGIIAPFLDLPYNETQRTIEFEQQVSQASTSLHSRGEQLYVMPYVGRHLTSPLEPTPEYVTHILPLALQAMKDGRIGGIISYATPMEDEPGMTRENPALDGRGRLSLAFPPGPVEKGAWAQASQSVELQSGHSIYWLTFWHKDWWGPNEPRGRLVKEVLLDDAIVWQQDAADVPANAWMQGGILEGPIDVTKFVKDKKSAVLTLRIRATDSFRGVPQDVSFDRLQSTGFRIPNAGFETTNGWKLEDSGGALVAGIDIYDPNHFRHLFEAVASEYASYRSH